MALAASCRACRWAAAAWAWGTGIGIEAPALLGVKSLSKGRGRVRGAYSITSRTSPTPATPARSELWQRGK
jgi:hypothetical protein